MDMRQQFALLGHDQHFLENGLQQPWETVMSGNQRWILIHHFPLPTGYNHDQVTVALLLPAGYPKAQIDMVYVHPHMARLDGRAIGQTSVIQQIDDKTYQRWSRHRTRQHPWDPNEDSVETHIYLIEDWFEREFEK